MAGEQGYWMPLPLDRNEQTVNNMGPRRWILGMLRKWMQVTWQW